MCTTETLRSYPLDGVPTTVSTAWDALYWIGDRPSGSAEDPFEQPILYATDTSGPHLVCSYAADNRVVTFRDVHAVPAARLDVDGCASRAFAVLTDPATAADPAVAPIPGANCPYPYHALTGRAIALFRPTRTAYYLSLDFNMPEFSGLYGIPVRDNNMIAWADTELVDTGTLPESVYDALEPLRKTLLQLEPR